MYSSYLFDDTKLYWFTYRDKMYQQGTLLIFNGECSADNQDVVLYNATVKFLYSQNGLTYFACDNQIYQCKQWDFKYRIIEILNTNMIGNKSVKVEKYMTDQQIICTVWYAIAMIIITLFKDRLYGWIMATIIYAWCTVSSKKS